MTSYAGLLQKLKEKGMTRSALGAKLGISSRTIAKIGRGEKIADWVLERIAEYFGCEVSDLADAGYDRKTKNNAAYHSGFAVSAEDKGFPALQAARVADGSLPYNNGTNGAGGRHSGTDQNVNYLLKTLREEKSVGLPGGIYHEMQIRMTYNSNHIEGSRLSEEQTRMIFETATISAEEGVLVDDVIETANHFRCIDLVIDRAEEPLTEKLIKELHRLLKQGTRDSDLPWFAVGDYKKRPNVVGGRKTARPSEVHARMEQLLNSYEVLGATEGISFNDIIRFHYEFERIHPFQDGNGRVGRLIALKECLRWNIVPFLIEDTKKVYYYRGLSMWEEEKGYLTDTCLDGQDTFRKLLEMFEIPVPDASDKV